jgi:coenzyme F420-dependent glucose-6-phosphate dehydrogenase
MSLRLGYKASAEQFPARQLLDSRLPLRITGLTSLRCQIISSRGAITTGMPPAPWCGWLHWARKPGGGASDECADPDDALSPSVVAHTFATLGSSNPGRVVLGVGSGEAMNETPATGGSWPKFKERSDRLAESIELIRQLWADERVDFEGDYYRTSLN